MKKISLNQNVGTPYLVAVEDGLKIYTIIKQELDNGNGIILSLEGSRSLTSIFLNASVGKLLFDFDKNEVREKVKFEGLTPTYKVILDRVLDTAEQFYKQQDSYKPKMTKYYGSNS